VAVIAVARKSAARTVVTSDRILLLDALWAPLLCWGNRLASSLPDHHGWARGDGGSGAVDGEAREWRGTRIRQEERIGAATVAAAGCRAANHPRGQDACRDDGSSVFSLSEIGWSTWGSRRVLQVWRPAVPMPFGP
jgi:hypothetical protein